MQSVKEGIIMKKVLKINISFIIIFSIVLTCLSLCFTCYADNTFSGGDGSEENPFLISNKSELNLIREHLNANFKLTNDIVFEDSDFYKTGSFYYNGIGFVPIGTDASPFTGVFDGNGYKIINLKMNFYGTASSEFKVLFPAGYTPGDSNWTGDYILDEFGPAGGYNNKIPNYSGLFGCNRGTIKNLGIENSELTLLSKGGISYLGMISGANKGVITECYVYNSVIDCKLDGGVILSAGGLCGNNFDAAAITNCYFNGRLNSDYYSGGICGYSSGSIENTYFLGEISGPSGKTDAISNGKRMSVNSYYPDNYSSTYGIGIKREAFGNSSSFYGFDFTNVWQMNTANKYPELLVVPQSLKKLRPAPDTAPVLMTLNYNNIGFLQDDNLEYSLDGINWQSDASFSNLSYIDEYTFYTRYKESDEYYASKQGPGYTTSLGYQFDANGDNQLDDVDLTIYRRFLAGWDVNPTMSISDVNNDGEFNDKDVSYLARIIAGWAL